MDVFTVAVMCGVTNTRFLFLSYSTLYSLFQLLILDKQWLILCVYWGVEVSYRHNTLAVGRQRIKNKETHKSS